jgi:dihydroorotase
MPYAAFSLILPQADDWHCHLRDGAWLPLTVAQVAGQFGRVLAMPNLTPPLTSIGAVSAYRQRLLQAMQATGVFFAPQMTLYLHPDLTPEEIEKIKDFPEVNIVGVKLYPQHATTNSAAGVADWRDFSRTFAAMARVGLPLLVHGEVTDPAVDVFDREAVFIEEVLMPLLDQFSDLKVVLEHITTKQAVEFIEKAPKNLAATITPQHLLFNRNALFQGGIRPHYYCLPVLKSEEHRQALLQAATSGNPKFFLGTDSAPHSQSRKENACGCAGTYTMPYALALYAEAFDSVGKIDKLPDFASRFGAAFYQKPVNKKMIRLEKMPSTIPEKFLLHDGQAVVPLQAGATLSWTFRGEVPETTGEAQ